MVGDDWWRGARASPRVPSSRRGGCRGPSACMRSTWPRRPELTASNKLQQTAGATTRPARACLPACPCSQPRYAPPGGSRRALPPRTRLPGQRATGYGQCTRRAADPWRHVRTRACGAVVRVRDQCADPSDAESCDGPAGSYVQAGRPAASPSTRGRVRIGPTGFGQQDVRVLAGSRLVYAWLPR
jgi:hypothetical protein